MLDTPPGLALVVLGALVQEATFARLTAKASGVKRARVLKNQFRFDLLRRRILRHGSVGAGSVLRGAHGLRGSLFGVLVDYFRTVTRKKCDGEQER